MSEFFEVLNLRGRIQALETDVSYLKAREQRMTEKIERLEKQVTHLSLLSGALWELLKQHASMRDEELTQAVASLPATSIAVKKEIQHPDECATCGHRISLHAARCLYCGAAVPVPA